MVLLGLTSFFLGTAQEVEYRHIIDLDTATHQLHLQTTVRIPSGDLPKDSLWLQLPSRSTQNRQSALHRELEEDQLLDLHYASAAKRGQIHIKKLRWNLPDSMRIKRGEFTAWPLPDSLPDTIVLRLNYHLDLPHRDLIGRGYAEELYSLIDWLPRVPYYRNQQWYRTPVNTRSSRFLSKDSFQIRITLPSAYELASSLPHQMRETAKPGSSRWTLSGQARSLQLHFSPRFKRHEMGSNQELYSLERHELMPSYISALEEEVSSFFQGELDDSLNQHQRLVMLPDEDISYQSAQMLSLGRASKRFDQSRKLAHARAQAAFRYRIHPNPQKYPWLAYGLPYYYQMVFASEVYPEERWLPYGDSWLGRLLDLDEFGYAYQNRFLYLFLARQGLAQSATATVDSLSRLNFQAVTQAKTFLLLSHLRSYLARGNFERGMRRYRLSALNSSPKPEDFQGAMEYFAAKPLQWWYERSLPAKGIYDYKVTDFEYCSTVSTATVKNTGHLKTPFSLTGIKNGEPVLTEWFPGHQGKRTVQLHHEDYDYVALNYHLFHPEFNPHNNRVYDRWIAPWTEPLRFQFYNNFELAQASQVFYMPMASYNAYDKLLLGAQLTNASLLVKKPWEYRLTPEISTGTGSLTGSASLRYNWTLKPGSLFRQISASVFGRYYHYDKDLAYTRLSPGINFFLRKPYPRSPLIQRLRLRAVMVDREMPQELDPAQGYELASYSVAQLSYRLENTAILHPTVLKADLEYADKFTKIYASLDQRWRLPNRKWLIWRSFAGVFLRNQFYKRGHADNFYSFGLSQRPDYLFDYQLLGRSDSRGLWSKQFFISDGGFKQDLGVRADRYLASTGLTVPLYSVIGLYGDAGWADDQFYWGYGARLGFITDFAEVYFPLQSQREIHWDDRQYWKNIRFVLNLDIDAIINRLRRGLY